MPDIGLAQVSALQRLFENYDSRTALEAFIEAQNRYYSGQCAEEMVQGREGISREHAYFAKCYRNMLDELKQFTAKQANKV